MDDEKIKIPKGFDLMQDGSKRDVTSRDAINGFLRDYCDDCKFNRYNPRTGDCDSEYGFRLVRRNKRVSFFPSSHIEVYKNRDGECILHCVKYEGALKKVLD